MIPPIEPAVFIVAAMFFVPALLVLVYSWVFRMRARKVEGVVVARRRAIRPHRHAPTFEYEIDGKKYRFESGMFGTSCPELGERRTIYCHPDDPEILVIEGWDGSRIFAGVFLALGCLVVFFGATVNFE